MSHPGSALAQPGRQVVDPFAEPDRAAATGDEKSERFALGLSLGSTVASYAVFTLAATHTEDLGLGGALAAFGGSTLGMWLAPSFGHLYADDKLATRGFWLRTGGLALALGGLIASIDIDLFCWGSDSGTSSCGDEDENDEVPYAIAAVGAGLMLWGTIDDIVTTPRRVRAHNARAARRDLAVVPVVRDGGGSLALVGRF